MADDRGVILDVDGTLVDSNDAHAHAWVEAARELGHDVDYEQVRPLIGMGGDRIMPRIAGVEEESAEGQALKERRSQLFRRRYLPEIESFPGVRRLVERLLDDRFDVVVASSAAETDLGPLLDRAGVADLIEQTTSSSDAEESKPEPDILEAAIGRSRVERERLVLIGDTPYDVEAARRARLPIIAVRSGGWDDEALAGAVAVLADAAAVLEEYEALFLAGDAWSR